METFEALLKECMPALARFVKFKIANRHDAEDILQETCIAAYEKFQTLKNRDSFKAWILRIARNKCIDYYRCRADGMDVSLEALEQTVMRVGRCGPMTVTVVSDTLSRLGDKDKQILYLYYFRELPQDEIAGRLGIPVGTVKSRLYHAKRNFKEQYPYPPVPKGENHMKKFPEIMPAYTIEKSDLPPFCVRWEEMMGWFIVPRLGEKLSWAMYDFPERKRTEVCHMEVIGRAEVHGIEGVEIAAVEENPMLCESAGGQKSVERRFVVQLTDTHCRCLAESHEEGGVKRYYTFLDGGSFLDNWGFGEDNCGNAVRIEQKGDIVKCGDTVTTREKPFLLDVVGRYTVTVGGRPYDTVCVVDCGTYNNGVLSEQFIDSNGRTVLWRRFNRDDWAISRYEKTWNEMLPDNERLTVNGVTYVHWYDCISDSVL